MLTVPAMTVAQSMHTMVIDLTSSATSTTAPADKRMFTISALPERLASQRGVEPLYVAINRTFILSQSYAIDVLTHFASQVTVGFCFQQFHCNFQVLVLAGNQQRGSSILWIAEDKSETLCGRRGIQNVTEVSK